MTTFIGSQNGTFPYSAVVFVSATFENGETYVGTYVGSGAIVGPNDILTA